MGNIILKPGESILVTAVGEGEPPVDPDPPIDPPVDPEPPIDPPDDSGPLYGVIFSDIFGRPLMPKTSYPNTFFLNIRKQGTSVAILLPEVPRDMTLRITDVESTYPSSSFLRYGVISNRRDFDAPFHDSHTWGQGGSVKYTVRPQDAGKFVYFNHRIKNTANRYEPYVIQFQAILR